MKKEIVSFNETVPEMSQLLEIDGAELELVTGGVQSCGALTKCETYDVSCGVNT